MSRRFDTGGAPHFPPHSTVSGVMLQVVFALIPAIGAHVWFFGPGILVQILLASLCAQTNLRCALMTRLGYFAFREQLRSVCTSQQGKRLNNQIV